MFCQMVSSFSITATIFLFSFFGLCSSTFVFIGQGNETDRVALLSLKSKITSDPLDVMLSWNATTHFCQWHGVTCGHLHRRVIMLDLTSLKLAGSVSPHIGNLSFLRVLALQNNSFNGEIPSEIGRLRRLQQLILSNNSFSGKIPSNISSCLNLINLQIGWNQLIGEIPGMFGSLSKLIIISTNHNNLTGAIPSSFGNLSSVETIFLGDNNLGGKIPESFGRLTNLSEFLVTSNKLSGTIPSSLFNLSLLTKFGAGDNQIDGSLPSNMGITLPNIQYFGIGFNNFSGSIPVSISNASKLELFQLPKNEFYGEVPSFKNIPRLQVLSISANHLGNDLSFLCSLTNATELWLLALNVNYFQGILPECVGNLSTALEILAVDNNMIHGSILAAGIPNLVNLQYLEMWNNNFSGNVPVHIGKLQKLQLLYLQNNNFSGQIPHSLGNLTLLTYLRLNYNSLHGTIPLSLSKCKNLVLLDLSGNYLSGFIPPQVIGLSSLSIGLDLSLNKLSGPLPVDVGNLKNLGVLLVYENMLSGEIPSSLGSCLSLEILSMEDNYFQGPIPSSLSALKALQVINFSHNNLSGRIPEFLSHLALLNKLNLSFNDFEGIVPIKGVFRNLSAISVMGNSKLCGGIPELQLPTCGNFKVSKSKRLTTKLKVIIATIAGLLGAALMICFIFMLRKRQKNNLAVTSPSTDNSLLRVSYGNLHDATNGFSSENLIGVGSFGSVYKGILQEGGPIVAVKVLNLQLHRAATSFISECEALKNIRHRNLVKVLTACSSMDYQGNDFKALVFEFMVNGSLEEWLHPSAGIADGNNNTPKNLNLMQRLTISIDVASALEYLHHQCETPIVHCDLKPSNVLLDDELTGHISDFGLAKFLLQSFSNFPANQSTTTGLRGTIGYAPPEYGLGREVSTYGDAYSYGILLLEMFTGKRPTDEMFKEGLDLHKFARLALTVKVTEILDPVLLQEVHEVGTSNRIMELLISIVGIGVACSEELPRERMSMADVAARLRSIRDKLLGYPR